MTSLQTAKRRVLFRQNAKDLVSTESLELCRSDEVVFELFEKTETQHEIKAIVNYFAYTQK